MILVMKKYLLLILCTLLCGCATDDTRRQAVSDAREQMHQRRSERIQARDQRMWEARDVWFQ